MHQEKIDLTPKLKRKMDPMMMGNDRAMLNNLCKDLNNPELTGAVVPPGAETTIPPEPIGRPSSTPVPPPPASPPAPSSPHPDASTASAGAATPAKATPVAIKFAASKIAFTGRLKSGKDYLAAGIGAQVFGFADPLYFLLEYYLGAKDKDAHGARSFLQTAGQWGRGVVSDEYPLTPLRAVFSNMVRNDPSLKRFFASVDWASYGQTPDLWLNACLRRVEVEKAAARVAITNARFVNEVERLREEGWKVFHVMCSPETWAARLAKDGLQPGPVTSNLSERMAVGLDQSVLKELSQHRQGPKLMCVWNDERVPCPSPRLFTTQEFFHAFTN